MSQVICGDAREKLKELPDGCAQTCVTSPPYYGLRDYGVSGQIGLEPTPDEFIARLVAVLREVKRVMRDDGTLWVNIGDSYATNQKGSGGANPKQLTNAGSFYNTAKTMPKTGWGDAKEKDLLGIPWMLAFALRADGWYLRSEIIWAKPNPMPESVTDRPTKSHEQIFLLSKSPHYYYDADAIKEPATYPNDDRKGRASEEHKRMPSEYVSGIRPRSARDSFKRDNSSRPEHIVPGQAENPHRPERADKWDISYRNKRDVWTVSTKPYSGAHFATFPRDLIVPCILAGSRPGDVVLDPFGGAGTTAKTAQELGREYITIELSQKYVDEIILPRLAATPVPLPMPTQIERDMQETQRGLL
jgi:DNA modification methylase